MTAPQVEIVVDELVVRGVGAGEARLLASGLETRLAALAATGEARLPARDEAFRRLPAVDAPAGSPAEAGEAVAVAVWNALGGGGS